MTPQASGIAEFGRVIISNNFTLGSGITQYATTNYKPQEVLDKTTDEAVKRLRCLCIPEFIAKGNKIRFESSNEILEEIYTNYRQGGKYGQEVVINIICLTTLLWIQTMKTIVKGSQGSSFQRKNERVRNKKIERSSFGISLPLQCRKSFEFVSRPQADTAFRATNTDQKFLNYFFLKILAEKKDIYNTNKLAFQKVNWTGTGNTQKIVKNFNERQIRADFEKES